MMNRKPQAQDQNYARKCPKLSQLFFPFFLNSPRTKMNGDMMNSPFFPLTWILHIYTSLSPESVRLHVVCMYVCPNSWAGLTEPEHHGWLLIIHPNNPYIT